APRELRAPLSSPTAAASSASSGRCSGSPPEDQGCCGAGGTALKGRVLNSLGFQPQAGGWPRENPNPPPIHLGLKPQAGEYPPIQGGQRCFVNPRAAHPPGVFAGAASGARAGAATQGTAKLRWPFLPTLRTAKYSLSVLVLSSTT